MSPHELKEIRNKLGLTQEALARLIGVSFQTVNRWERGLFKPSPLAVEKLKSIMMNRQVNNG